MSPPSNFKMTVELVDICFNFTHSSFRKDEQLVLQRALEAGVTTLMITGSSVAASRYGIELAEHQPDHLYATVGIHPHLAQDWTSNSLAELRDLAQHERVKAIGEAGLDYNRNYSTRQSQRYAFEQQIELACDLGMPLFVHERDAHKDLITLLRQYRENLTDIVVHCFTGTVEQLEAYLEMDLHVGITGWICDERRGHHLHDLIKRIPLSQLMIETDAPYLIPRDLKPQPKGRRNEPAYLPHILETVAKHLSLPPETVANSTTATARRFFRLNDLC